MRKLILALLVSAAALYAQNVGGITQAGGGGGGISGSGTTNAVPKFTGTSAVGNSSLTDNGTTVSTSEIFSVNSNYAISTGGVVTTAGGLATVLNGHAIEVATVDTGSQNAAITATTMFTPSATGIYRLSGYISEVDGGTACSGNGTVSVNALYTNAINAVAVTDSLGIHIGSQSTTSAMTLVPSGFGSGQEGTIISDEFYATSGVAIRYSTGYSAGASCTTGQHYRIIFTLELM